jgi:hypothetical protein
MPKARARLTEMAMAMGTRMAMATPTAKERH